MNLGDLFNGNPNVPPVVIEFYNRVLGALNCLTQDSADTATSTTGTARTLAYQFGVPPEVGSEHALTARSLVSLPKVYEDTTEASTRLEVMADTGRCASSGWVSNLGDDPFKVQLISWDKGSTDPFTLPPAASFQVMCLVREVVILPADGKAAEYQAVLS